jgi:hypothetical protein
LQGYNDEYDESQSPLEIKEELDDEDQDTNAYDDSCDNQDSSSSHVEHTDIIEISQDEFQNLDSYDQEEYVIEDSADAQLENEVVVESMQEESDNDRSQSLVRETNNPFSFKVKSYRT